jgi:hypothetical protein
MSINKLSRLNLPNVQARAELPTVPDAFRRSDYEGLIPETIKRIQLKAYQRTQAERLAVLKQINAIQGECLALARNENEWHHFDQVDRLRQKRLDIEEIELDIRMEELQERRNGVKEKVRREPPPRRDPIQEALDRLRLRLRAGVEARSECERLKEEYPDSASEIEREFLKLIWDLREGL